MEYRAALPVQIFDRSVETNKQSYLEMVDKICNELKSDDQFQGVLDKW